MSILYRYLSTGIYVVSYPSFDVHTLDKLRQLPSFRITSEHSHSRLVLLRLPRTLFSPRSIVKPVINLHALQRILEVNSDYVDRVRSVPSLIRTNAETQRRIQIPIWPGIHSALRVAGNVRSKGGCNNSAIAAAAAFEPGDRQIYGNNWTVQSGHKGLF